MVFGPSISRLFRERGPQLQNCLPPKQNAGANYPFAPGLSLLTECHRAGLHRSPRRFILLPLFAYYANYESSLLRYDPVPAEPSR
jgi:hypothetical protein